jgi:ribonucleotide reductase beta subunit family protein with ferritin-like domain
MSKPKKSIFTPRSYYKPFDYPEAFEFYEQHEKLHWLPDEVPMSSDILDWKHKLNDTERHFLTQIFRLFTQSDIDVAQAYATNYLPMFPVPEIRMMLLSFGSREAIHIQAYAHLIDTLGMPEVTYKQFHDYEAMKDKHDFIEEFIESDGSNLAEQIACFSAFTEGMQLFSSFIMLLNFTRFNKMNGMGQIISWSIRDEQCLIEDTEVLTDKGYKKIQDISLSDNVAQYDINTQEISFVNPSRVIKTEATESYIFTGYGYHQHVTGDHRMILANKEVKLAKDCNDIELGLRTDDTYVINPTEITKTKVYHEKTNFYCLTVPSGAFVIKSNDEVSITGNCHVDGMTWLFKQYIKENRHIWTKELQDKIYRIAEKMVELEDKFIDLAFEMGAIEGLTSDEVKTYIRYITDRRLIGLSMKGLYKVKTNPLPWVEELLNAPEHASFFETRATAYAKGALTGSWDNVWA